MRILSADDNAENLCMLEALLRGHGHVVDSASNGFEALKLAERGAYDLVIADILMPRMDGFALCREMKKDQRLRQVPFVFYTATYTDPRDASFALSIGADRFLVKPQEADAFIREIEEVVSKKTPPAPARDDEPDDEAIYLKEYNARLVGKLEKRMLDLDAANRLLQDEIDERDRAAATHARIEEKLPQSQKLEALGTLAGGIAHDFNNILGGIIGHAELGIAEAADPAASAATFREILKAGARARDLVRQILSFSPEHTQDRKPLDLETAVGYAIKLMRATLPGSVEIVTEFENSAPRVLADSVEIIQIVTNLLSSAWHAIGKSAGRIRVQIASFTVDANFASAHPDLRPGRYVRLSVGGTGLDLSVVHGIMKASDGAIIVDSEPGAHSTVHLYFPALDFEIPPLVAPEPSLAQGGGQSILFIDDEPVLANLGERFLARLGYAAIIVRNPADALAAFREKPFDLVITDLSMPQMSGIDLARQLWEIRPGTRVILTTGYSATLDTSRAREIGFCELLLKPYNIQALGACIKRALGT